MRSLRFTLAAALVFLALPTIASAQTSPCCVVPDNGSGTANHPPNCVTGYQGPMEIVDGLMPVGTVQIAAKLHSFTGLVQVPGGSLGGMKENWNATLDMAMAGTGGFAAYNRFLQIPVVGESHSAPRVPFAITQPFATTLWTLQGQITLDPDFDLLRVTAGDGFGMPSPGNTTFISSGGGWAVDSFFDITYRIDFVGNPAGPFAGRSGSTTRTARFDMCHEFPTPAAPASWGAVKAFYR
ncbi:MAG: hypothetical protein ACREOU_01895 [Candidatus Eiseniibacteriota bacterium]